jgi:hypothetical protein
MNKRYVAGDDTLATRMPPPAARRTTVGYGT